MRPTVGLGDKVCGKWRRSRLPRVTRTSDPRQVVVGPNGISGQFILLGVDRKRFTSATDELTLRLRVVSRAMADLVTPFQSAMLELRSQGLEPINPQHAFLHPIPAGEGRDEDIVFMIPSTLSLDRMACVSTTTMKRRRSPYIYSRVSIRVNGEKVVCCDQALGSIGDAVERHLIA